jgi:5-(carboxyamino)imidazole ribonucleotide synthase
LVEYLFSPAQIQDSIAEKAESLAKAIIEKLEMVGLLAVEMFVTKSGEILINEIAPRPHNSGHQSIEGNITSQFEQHLRAIYGLPLGDTKIVLPSAMVNLLGEEGYSGPVEYVGLEEILKTSAVHLHLYGKNKTQSFRKMGHITVTDENIETLKEKALYVKNTFKIISK